MAKKNKRKNTNQPKKEIRMKKEVLDDASIGKRILAFLVDWYVGGMLSMIPVAFMWNKKTNETSLNLDIKGLEAQGLLAAVLAILILILYFYVIPMKVWPGQTLGKRICSIAVVNEDGSYTTRKRLAIRQVAGWIFLETPAIMTGNPVLALFGLMFDSNVEQAMQYASVALLAISILSMLFSKKHLALHDRLAHTKVVYLPREKVAF